VLRFTLQRLILLPVLLFLFSIIVFILIQAPPGDYLDSYVATLASSGSSIDAEQIEALKEQFGLDQPIHVQYLLWVETSCAAIWVFRWNINAPTTSSLASG
jgi:peptide/nickel transport system permease protein